MNLHSIVSGAIGVVNPHVLLQVKISTGSTTDDEGKRVPSYASPGVITASIADNTMTVTAISAGAEIMVGQSVTGVGVEEGTKVMEVLTGDGGIGTYKVSPAEQTVASVSMATDFVVEGQIQALTFKDIQHVDGLNLNGTRRAIYFYGQIDGLVRTDRKGGDLVVHPNGSVWLVAMVLEQWDDGSPPAWCKVVVTLQNGE